MIDSLLRLIATKKSASNYKFKVKLMIPENTDKKTISKQKINREFSRIGCILEIKMVCKH